mgnify:CR=1 FL=1
MQDTAIDVRHDAARHRFSTLVDGVEAYVEYEPEDGALAITHTIVPAPISGRGIAASLVRAAVDHARALGLKVRPACSYAAAWLRRHPEYGDLRA